MTPVKVDDIVATVEEAVRRAYALGRADAMKRVVELAQSDDPSLRAMALLNAPEPPRPAPAPALLDAPQPAPSPAPASPPPQPQLVEAHEKAADAADEVHEARQAAAAPQPALAEVSAGSGQPAATGQPGRKAPATAGEFLADFFYPIGSKKR